MSGSAGLSAAKRRRAEPTPQTPPTPQLQQSKPQVQSNANPNTKTSPNGGRIMTPMLILEDHELRLRHIENCLKDGQSKSDTNEKMDSSSTKKDIVVTASSSSIDDEFKSKITAILSRIDELESNNSDLLKKVDTLKTELSVMTDKHSNLQKFAMETNISLLKHKDTFEPAVFKRLMSFIMDKTTSGDATTSGADTSDAAASETVASETASANEMVNASKTAGASETAAGKIKTVPVLENEKVKSVTDEDEAIENDSE